MKTLEALTEGLFDYAGLFPPAELGLEDMLREAAGLPDTLQRPAIVGSDLVLTPDRLDTITTEHLLEAGFRKNRHVKVCLVGIETKDGAAMANRVLAFNRESRVDTVPHEITSIELHSAIDDVNETAGALMPARFVLAGQQHIQVYWEPKLTDAEWQERFDEVFAVLDAAHSETELPIVGLKVRCAGPNALSAATLARIIPELTQRDIPFKATQGLHHPLAGDGHLGFLGLAVALRLHEEHALDADEIEACITEREAAAFDFKQGLAWRGHFIDRGRLGHAMMTPFAIGSCSLQEPDDGLAAHWPLVTA